MGVRLGLSSLETRKAKKTDPIFPYKFRGCYAATVLLLKYPADIVLRSTKIRFLR